MVEGIRITVKQMTKIFFQNPARDRKVRQDRLFNKRIDGKEVKIMGRNDENAFRLFIQLRI